MMPTRFEDLDDSDLLKVSGINVQRQLLDAMTGVGRHLKTQTEEFSALGKRLNDFSDRMGDMHTDIEVMKERDKTYDAMKLLFEKMDERLSAMELRAAQQDGAFSLAKAAKDFGPWLLAIAAFFWGLLERAPK